MENGTCVIIRLSSPCGAFLLHQQEKQPAGRSFLCATMIKRKCWYKAVYGEEKEDDYYNTQAWRRLRRACLYRDRYHCQRCDKRFKSELLTAHHIIPRAEDGPDLLHNLVTLCNECHDFVEICDIRTYAGILGSCDDNTTDPTPQPDNGIDLYNRPEWHKYVYGGVRRGNR